MTDKWTIEQIESLRSAMAQVLDDFGEDGKSVCGATKAEARVAFQPFLDDDFDPPAYSFEAAAKLLVEL